jgi:acetyl esterase
MKRALTPGLIPTTATLLLLATTLAQAAGVFKENVPFATVDNGEVLTLDAWIPEGPGPFPAVIVVHGGGFVNGDKQTYVKPLFDPLKASGFAWFTINYRLAPKVHFPVPQQDLGRAIKWVKANAKDYKVSPNKIALMGESAGASIVGYVAVHPGPGEEVSAVVNLYGVYDWVQRSKQRDSLGANLSKLLGLPPELTEPTLKKLKEISPTTYLSKNTPPFYLIHGTRDVQVPYDQSVLMCEEMKTVGAKCELLTLPGGGHGMGGWEKIPGLDVYKEKMIQWLRQTWK